MFRQTRKQFHGQRWFSPTNFKAKGGAVPDQSGHPDASPLFVCVAMENWWKWPEMEDLEGFIDDLLMIYQIYLLNICKYMVYVPKLRWSFAVRGYCWFTKFGSSGESKSGTGHRHRWMVQLVPRIGWTNQRYLTMLRKRCNIPLGYHQWL